MSLEVVKQRSRGFICVNAHPAGCRENVRQQIRTITSGSRRADAGPKNVIVVGSSTGYGLASRIAAAWGSGARTLGIFFERSPEGRKTATAGYYNNVALHEFAKADGLFAASINGDAFTDDVKRSAVQIVRQQMSPVDLVIYSLAAPKRTDPASGEVHNSVLKPIGEAYSSKSIDLSTGKVIHVTIPPADEKEIADTVAVMGGDDWRLWMELLLKEGLLAEGAQTIAYSYIGPELTWPIYRAGTVGRAKEDLERTARELNSLLKSNVGGEALISINKAVVTQASAAIPVVPLYMSTLLRVMGMKGVDEEPIDQMRRLFADYLTDGRKGALDSEGRIRLDDREMRPEIQSDVAARWAQLETENLATLADFEGYTRRFRNLFGFDVPGVNYEEPVEIDVGW